MSEIARPAPDLQELYDALDWWVKQNNEPLNEIPEPKGNQYICHDYWNLGKPILVESRACDDMLYFLDELMTKKMERESNE
jgi:hypothetical protein